MGDEIAVMEQESVEETIEDGDAVTDEVVQETSSIAISKKRAFSTSKVVSGVRGVKGAISINLGGLIGFILLKATNLLMGISTTLASLGDSAKAVPILGNVLDFLLGTILSTGFSIVGIVIKIPCYAAIGAAIILDVILLLRLVKMLISKISDALRRRRAKRRASCRQARISACRSESKPKERIEQVTPMNVNVTVCNQIPQVEQPEPSPVVSSKTSTESVVTKEIKEIEKLNEF